MPFKSEKQRKFMYAKHPSIAKRWADEYGSKPIKKGGKVKKNWIAGAIKNPGALRKTAGVKKGKKIAKGALNKLAKKSGVTGKRARLAKTLGKFNRSSLS